MRVFKTAVIYFFQIINFLIMVRILLSWVGRGVSNGFTDFIYQVTEPLLAPFRNLQYKLGLNGPLDFSPILLILALVLLRNILLGL